MQKWMGRNVNDLVARWGPPSQIMSDGAGGRVFIYVADRGWLYPATSVTSTRASGGVYGNQLYGNVTSQTVYYPGMVMSYTAYRIFWIDSTGRITAWSWKGI